MKGTIKVVQLVKVPSSPKPEDFNSVSIWKERTNFHKLSVLWPSLGTPWHDMPFSLTKIKGGKVKGGLLCSHKEEHIHRLKPAPEPVESGLSHSPAMR